MKNIILDTDYAEVSHESEFKLGKIREYAKNHEAQNFLSDIREQSVVSPENRKWFEEIMIPQAIDVGLKRAAVIFDGNVFKKYYLNMIIKVTNKFGLPLKIFNSEEEAIEWFKSF